MIIRVVLTFANVLAWLCLLSIVFVEPEKAEPADASYLRLDATNDPVTRPPVVRDTSPSGVFMQAVNTIGIVSGGRPVATVDEKGAWTFYGPTGEVVATAPSMPCVHSFGGTP